MAPERVEAVLRSAPVVDQIFVHGNSAANALVAIVVSIIELNLHLPATNRQI